MRHRKFLVVLGVTALLELAVVASIASPKQFSILRAVHAAAVTVTQSQPEVPLADRTKVVAFLKGVSALVTGERDTHGWNPVPWIQESKIVNLEQLQLALQVAQFCANPDLSDRDFDNYAGSMVFDEPALRLFGLYEGPPPAPAPPNVSNPLGAEFAQGKRYAVIADPRAVGAVYLDGSGATWVKVGRAGPFGSSLWYERRDK